jgi:hypothetical protein
VLDDLELAHARVRGERGELERVDGDAPEGEEIVGYDRGRCRCA